MDTTVANKKLDDKGRCCGRKPIVYKTPYFRYFCPRCDREYNENGVQECNWAFPELPKSDNG